MIRNVFKISLFQTHERDDTSANKKGSTTSINQSGRVEPSECLDGADLISGVLERVWLWAWCGYKANSRIRSLCLLFMRVRGKRALAGRELWALLEINWICEKPVQVGLHNEPGSNRQPFLLALTRHRVTLGLHFCLDKCRLWWSLNDNYAVMMILLTGIPIVMLWTMMCARCLWVPDNPITSLLTSLMYHDTPEQWALTQPRQVTQDCNQRNHFPRTLGHNLSPDAFLYWFSLV